MLSNRTIKKEKQIERVEVSSLVKNNKFYNCTKIKWQNQKKIENSDWFRSIYLYKYGRPARSFASQPFEVLSLLITQRGNGGVKEIREDGEADNGQEQEEE